MMIIGDINDNTALILLWEDAIVCCHNCWFDSVHPMGIYKAYLG